MFIFVICACRLIRRLLENQFKSVEICVLKVGEVVQTSEHPLSLDESKASVLYVQDKISTEAFSGARVKLERKECVNC